MKIKCSECLKFFDDKDIYLTDTDHTTMAGQRVFGKYLCKKCVKGEKHDE